MRRMETKASGQLLNVKPSSLDSRRWVLQRGRGLDHSNKSLPTRPRAIDRLATQVRVKSDRLGGVRGRCAKCSIWNTGHNIMFAASIPIKPTSFLGVQQLRGNGDEPCFPDLTARHQQARIELQNPR